MRLRKTVLVVDDERGARVSATMVLRDRYPVVSVANGVEAMELADTYPPATGITNNRMPGMSGLELLAWFRIRYPLLPFIILTGYRTRETIRRAVELRVNFYITKPYDPKTLRAAVDHGIFEDQIHFTPDADGKLLLIWSRLLGFRRVLGQCRQRSSLDWDFMASDLERLRDLLTEAVAGYGPDPESILPSALLRPQSRKGDTQATTSLHLITWISPGFRSTPRARKTEALGAHRMPGVTASQIMATSQVPMLTLTLARRHGPSLTTQSWRAPSSHRPVLRFCPGAPEPRSGSVLPSPLFLIVVLGK
jgi:CheY-like chemotaxis protein